MKLALLLIALSIVSEPIVPLNDDTPAYLTLEEVIEPGLSFDRRPGALSYDYLTAYTLGPIAIGDFSQGITNRIWRARMYGSLLKIAKQNIETPTEYAFYAEEIVLETGLFPQEIDVAFDQAGRVFLTMEVNGRIWIYFYDPTIPGHTLVDLCDGRTPRCTQDLLTDIPNSDIALFYIRGEQLRHRTQDDRYVTEYDTGLTTTGDIFVEDATFTVGSRVVVLFSRRDSEGRYRLEYLYSALQPIQMLESWKGSTALQSGELRVSSFIVTQDENRETNWFAVIDEESWKATTDVFSGILAQPIILHTLYDKDEWKASTDVQSGVLVTILILHTLYDKDEWKGSTDVNSGTLVVVVIENVLYDKAEWKTSTDVNSGSLVVV